MFDVSNGKIRTRAWPSKRGKPKTEADALRQAKFRNAQQMSKYIAPDMYADFISVTDGTPLLPRDLITMMFYNRMYAFVLPNGKTMWPMPAVNEVSESLDVLGAEVGRTLVRKPEGWRQSDFPSLFEVDVVADVTIAAATPYVQIDGLDDWPILWLYCQNLTASSSGQRQAYVSVDNGAHWLNTSGDYNLWAATGIGSAVATFSLHSTAATAARSAFLSLPCNAPGVPIIGINPMQANITSVTNFNGPVTNMRVRNSAGNLTAGRVLVVGQR